MVDLGDNARQTAHGLSRIIVRQLANRISGDHIDHVRRNPLELQRAGLPLAVALNRESLHLQHLRTHRKVDAGTGPGRDGDRIGYRVVAQVIDPHRVGAGREIADGIAALPVRRRGTIGALHGNRSAVQKTTIVGIANLAGNRLRQGGRSEHRKRGAAQS